MQDTEAVKALRDFVMSFEEQEAREREFFRSLSMTVEWEDNCLMLEVKEKRQFKIHVYFRKSPMNREHYCI